MKRSQAGTEVKVRQEVDSQKTCIIHQNIRSLGNSVDTLEELLERNPHCSVLCLTEHWQTNEHLKVTGIIDFKLAASFCRNRNEHGGVAVFVRNDIPFLARKSLCALSVKDHFECAAAECKIGNKQIIIVTVYRTPKADLGVFIEKLEFLLLSIIREDKLIFLAGDFNIEMLRDNDIRTDFLSLLQSFHLQQTIFEDTRVTATSESCLDNIFTNCDIFQAHVIETHISDHKAQIISFPVTVTKNNNFRCKRLFKEIEKKNFLEYLSQQSWDEVFCLPRSNVDKQWEVFMNTFLTIFYQTFPLKRVHKSKKNSYFKSEAVVECKRKLDKLWTLKTHNALYNDQYNSTKKEYDLLLRTERSKIYENKTKMSDNKAKCLWYICNEITGKRCDDRSCRIEGEPEVIANDYNNYLLSIIPQLLNNIGNIPHHCSIQESNKSMYYLRPINSVELIELSRQIKNKHSSGDDEIPTSLIKHCIYEIKHVLCYIINNSMKFGIFPSQLKLALIKPLYKKGSPSMMSNYRPISILPSFSKLFELVLCSRLVHYMEVNDLFSKSQHGYLRGRSTTTAIYQFIQTIIDNLESKNLVLGMFLDLSKAYDCLDHTLLLKKLDKYGIRGNTYRWLESYLSDRRQRVILEKDGTLAKSSIKINNMGVPQGSVIGPVLFVIYLGDFVVPNVSVSSFADDTNLLVHGKTISEIETRADVALSNACDWFERNRLLVNRDKTNVILFRTRQLQLDRHEVKLSEADIAPVENCSFLGVQIDEFLNWKNHISHVCSRLSSVCYGIRTVKKYMNTETLKILYFANFESVVRYGIIFWASNSDVQRVFVIQKRVIRIIHGMKYRESCRGIFGLLNIMTVYAVYIYECLMFVFRNKEKFQNDTDHEYNTRNLDIFYPQHRLTLTEKSPYYRCIKFYNKLPHSTRIIESQNGFKKAIRSLLIDLEPYSINEYLGRSWDSF